VLLALKLKAKTTARSLPFHTLVIGGFMVDQQSNITLTLENESQGNIVLPLVAGMSVLAGFAVSGLPAILSTATNPKPQSTLPPGATIDPGYVSQAQIAVIKGVAQVGDKVSEWMPQIDAAPIFAEAETARQQSQFRRSCDILSIITSSHPEYQKAQDLIQDNGRQILARALDKYKQGKPDVAVAYLQAIPAGTEAFNLAQQYLTDWQSHKL
jgi:hypothetical protein